MNDIIYSELKSKIKLPVMTLDKAFVSKCNTDILRHRSTKQVIKLTADEVKQILSEKEINLPKFLLKYEDGLKESDTSKYTDLVDGYQVSEYFSNADIFIPTFDYFRAVKFGNIDMILNIYNGNNCKIPFRQVLDKIKIQSEKDIEVYNDSLPFGTISDEIKYAMFTESVYYDDIKINKYMYKFPALCVNLPYEYYSKQDIPENIFYWDINKKELGFAGRTTDEVFEMFESICKNGLTAPLYFRISQGKITSASDDDYIKLIIAQFLKLPVIPAVIYLMKNNIESDMLISMRPCDIINAHISDLNTDDNMYKIINNICNPYFIFTNSAEKDKLESSVQNPSEYSENYSGPIYNYIKNNETSMDFYITNNTISEINDDENLSPEELHTKLHQEVQNQIDADIADALKRLSMIQ